jgi:hypothetical protein
LVTNIPDSLAPGGRRMAARHAKDLLPGEHE